jgi:hypothetical protein
VTVGRFKTYARKLKCSPSPFAILCSDCRSYLILTIVCAGVDRICVAPQQANAEISLPHGTETSPTRGAGSRSVGESCRKAPDYREA